MAGFGEMPPIGDAGKSEDGLAEAIAQERSQKHEEILRFLGGDKNKALDMFEKGLIASGSFKEMMKVQVQPDDIAEACITSGMLKPEDFGPAIKRSFDKKRAAVDEEEQKMIVKVRNLEKK